MEMKEILGKIMDALSEASDGAVIEPDMDFLIDMDLSSIELVEFLFKIEQDFGVKITARDMRNIDTPEELAEFLSDRI